MKNTNRNTSIFSTKQINNIKINVWNWFYFSTLQSYFWKSEKRIRMTDRLEKKFIWIELVWWIVFYSIHTHTQTQTQTSEIYWHDKVITEKKIYKNRYENWIVCLFNTACNMNMSILFIYHRKYFDVHRVICIIEFFFHSFSFRSAFFLFFHFQYFSNTKPKKTTKKDMEFNSIWVVRNEPHSINHRSIHYILLYDGACIRVCVCVFVWLEFWKWH